MSIKQTIFFGAMVVLFAFLPYKGFSQNQNEGELRVVIRSADNGEPLIGAHIEILDAELEERIQITVTNVDGYASFTSVPFGQSGIRVSYLGYRTLTGKFTLKSKVSVLRLDLEPSLNEMQEVVVRGGNEYEDGSAGLDRISSQDLSRIPTAGLSGDLSSYLQAVPGIVSTGDTGGDLYIRGGLPSQNIVLVDDIPVVKPFHISNIYSAFPENVISNVDVYTGGFGAEYMNATSAVVDVSLRPGNLQRGAASATFSPFIGAFSAEAPLVKDQSSLLLSARVSTMEEGTRRLSTRTQNVNFYDLLGRYTLNTESFNCNLTAILTNDEGIINPLRDQEYGWTNGGAGIRCFGFDRILSSTFDFSLGYSTFNNYEQDRFDNRNSSGLRQAWMAIGINSDLFGLDWNYGIRTTVQAYRAELNDRFSNIESYDSGLPMVQMYLNTLLEPAEGLRIRPSLGSITGVNGGPTLEPRVRMAYRPPGMRNSEFSFAAGRYFQLADGIQDQRNTGNVFTIWRPSPRNNTLQQALHLILGYRQRIGDHLMVNTEVYAKNYRNQIVARWTPESQISTETALADGNAYGAELRLSYEKQRFYGLLTYGIARVEFEAARDDLGAWINGTIFRYNPAHDQRHKINAIAAYDFGFVRSNIRWEFGTGLPYTRVFGFDLYVPVPVRDPDLVSGTARTLYDRAFGALLPTYHRLDISFQKDIRITKAWSVAAEVGAYNIYDRDNIFLVDVNELVRIDQIAFAPYLSIRTSIN